MTCIRLGFLSVANVYFIGLWSHSFLRAVFYPQNTECPFWWLSPLATHSLLDIAKQRQAGSLEAAMLLRALKLMGSLPVLESLPVDTGAAAVAAPRK